MLLTFHIRWLLITVFPSLIYLFRRSNLESNLWILRHPKAKAKSATGNVHSRVAVGIRDPSSACGSASALSPRYSTELILHSFDPGIFSPWDSYCLEAGVLTPDSPDCFQLELKRDINLVMSPARRKAISCSLVGKGGKIEVSGTEPVATTSVHFLF